MNLKDIKDASDDSKMHEAIQILILDDPEMRENSLKDIIARITYTFNDEQYLKRVSDSRQRWIDEDIHEIADGIIEYISQVDDKYVEAKLKEADEIAAGGSMKYYTADEISEKLESVISDNKKYDGEN